MIFNGGGEVERRKIRSVVLFRDRTCREGCGGFLKYFYDCSLCESVVSYMFKIQDYFIMSSEKLKCG